MCFSRRQPPDVSAGNVRPGNSLGRLRSGVACFVLQPTHLGTFIAVDLVARAGLTMMRQDERSIRAIILVMMATLGYRVSKQSP